MIDGWLRVEVTTIHSTGEEMISYSHTPEEFVSELRRRGECIYVTKGSCSECMYTPERSVPKGVVRDATNEALALHRIPECICITVAHFQRRLSVPNFVVCYGFFYQHWHESKYLLAAHDVGLVTFVDVTNLPGLRETGLLIARPYMI